MDDKHNKLDDFLRDQLHDSSEDPTWNVPDDRVFENAMQAIHADKKKKRRGWMILPLLFISVLIGIEYIHLGQVESLEHKIASLEDSLSSHADNEAAHLAAFAAEENNMISSDKITNDIASYKTSTMGAEEGAPLSISDTEENNTISSGKNTNDITSTMGEREAAPLSILSGHEKNQKATTESKGNVTTPPAEFSDNGINRVEKQNQALAVASDIGAADENGLRENEVVPTYRSEEESTNWQSSFIAPLSIEGLYIPAPEINIALSTPYIPEEAPAKSVLPWQYGLLFGGNQSWMTMKNIPLNPDAYLHDYDNHQTGRSFYGIVNKSISAKFLLQGGLGYHVYQNRSVLESRFLFDTDNIVQAPNGDPMYQTDIDLMNPIGDFNTPLEFRVTDQMNEEDEMTEHTTIEQTLQSVRLDLQMRGTMLTINNFRVSLGTGLGLAYRSGLKNTFNVSTYHNHILQQSQTETPDQLTNVRKWYVQWLGSLNLEYDITDRFGFILSTQYDRGLTSIRNTPATNGPLTFVHAFSISAGLTRTF